MRRSGANRATRHERHLARAPAGRRHDLNTLVSMPEPVAMLVLGLAAFASAIVGSVAGSGGTAILMPVVVLQLGVHAGIPALTIANFVANASRVLLNYRAIDRRVAAWFLLGAVPLTLLGSWLFMRTEATVLLRLLGVFMIVMVAWRRLAPRPPRLRNPRLFAPVGAVFGLLYGFLEGVGPLMAPFFLGYGLFRGAYIGTDALGTVVIQGAKLGVFGSGDLLVGRVLASGLLMAPFMVLGTWAGKRVVERFSDRAFSLLIEATLLVSGVAFLWHG